MSVSENPVRPGRYLSLTIGGDVFAIGIDSVREILDDTAVTRIPWTPPWMRGVINVRGTAVPVMDLAAALGLGAVAHTLDTRIVILECLEDDAVASMGCLADSVEDVLTLSAEAVERQGPNSRAGGGDCLQGIVRLGERFVLVLDVKRVFALSVASDPAAVPPPPVQTEAGLGR